MTDYPQPVSSKVATGNEEQLIEALSQLHQKSSVRRKKDTLCHLVFRCYSYLKDAKDKGHSYEEIADLVQTQLGKAISPGTLRKYMNRAAKTVDGDSPPSEEPPVVRIPSRITKPISKELPKQRSVEPKQTLPRPTLYSRDAQSRANEDEFENL